MERPKPFEGKKLGGTSKEKVLRNAPCRTITPDSKPQLCRNVRRYDARRCARCHAQKIHRLHDGQRDGDEQQEDKRDEQEQSSDSHQRKVAPLLCFVQLEATVLFDKVMKRHVRIQK